MKVTDLDRMNPFVLYSLMIAAVGIIGWLDYTIGEFYSLFLLYIFPIFVSSWSKGRNAGILLAVISSFLWLYVDNQLHTIPQGLEFFVFILFSRMILFTIMAILFSGYRGLYDKIQIQAYHDAMTGAYNYRAFLDFSERELARSRRHDTRLVLAYFDMDNFKVVNDQFGHSEGDRVLSRFSKIVQENIRDTDLFARIGGDEFLALFVETETEQAYGILERIRSHFINEMVQRKLPVTVSIGVTDVFPLDASFEAIIHQADQLMYQAKLEGRNRICMISNRKTDNES